MGKRKQSTESPSTPATSPDFSKFGFFKRYLLPALMIFLVPTVGLITFLYTYNQFSHHVRNSILYQVGNDQTLPDDVRTAVVASYTDAPLSTLLADQKLVTSVDMEIPFYFAALRWMIRLSVISIIATVALIVLAGICGLLSFRSLRAPTGSLYLGWHILRFYCVLQTVIQAVLLLSLAYVVAVFWSSGNSVPQILLFAGGIAMVGAVFTIAAVFKRAEAVDYHEEGAVIDSNAEMPLWEVLSEICATVGTASPQQVIAGNTDQFYVTELPVVVEGTTYHGRTLYVSLPHLKVMRDGEVRAVLAHEMAHFSGDDTVYSKEIAPYLWRFNSYLRSLYDGGFSTRSAFYLMKCLHALYWLFLSRYSRAREFRADRIAAKVTSPEDFATALLRTATYSRARRMIMQQVFEQEQSLESISIVEQVETLFAKSLADLATDPIIETMTLSHPFDSHPPVAERLAAIGLPCDTDQLQALLSACPDGKWFQYIPDAAQLERQQWATYEERFRKHHEEVLPYRLLPATEEELTIVAKAFPEIRFSGENRTFTVDCEKITYHSWEKPVWFREIEQITVGQDNLMEIACTGPSRRRIYITFSVGQEGFLKAIHRYYARYSAAAQYQKQKKLGKSVHN